MLSLLSQLHAGTSIGSPQAGYTCPLLLRFPCILSNEISKQQHRPNLYLEVRTISSSPDVFEKYLCTSIAPDSSHYDSSLCVRKFKQDLITTTRSHSRRSWIGVLCVVRLTCKNPKQKATASLLALRSLFQTVMQFVMQHALLDFSLFQVFRRVKRQRHDANHASFHQVKLQL